MTREQQYIQEQYMRRQSLLRHAAIIAGGAYDEEQHRKENPETPQDIEDGLLDPTVTKMTINKDITITGESLSLEKGRTLTMTIGDGTIATSSTQVYPNDSAFIVHNGAKVTINENILENGNGGFDATDVYAASAGHSAAAGTALKVTKSGDLSSDGTAIVEINGGTFKGKNYGVSGNGGRSNTSITINDGTFSCTTSADSVAVFHPQQGDLTINGGTFEAGDALWIKCGNIKITGGYFHGVGPSADYVYSSSGFNNTGDCVVIDNCGYPGGPINLSVMDGTFVSDNAKPIASYSYGGRDAISGFVYGGTFNKPIDEWLIAEGYELSTVVENEKYMVVKSN